MLNEYIIAFSSFYKAAYAQDLLEEAGINASLRKLPIEIAKSCSTGVYLKIDTIERAKNVLEIKNVFYRGIYRINRNPHEKTTYTTIN